MNIGLDARTLTDKKTGMGYYLESVLNNILTMDKENNYFLFSDREIVFSKVQNFTNLHIVEYNDGIVLKKSFFYAYKLKSVIKNKNIKLDVFWGTQHVLPLNLSKDIKKIVTMHDVVAYIMPETMTKYNYIINKLLIPKSLLVSDKIISISQSTDAGIKKYLSKYTKNSEMKVVYSGADTKKFTEEEEIKFFEKYKDYGFIKENKYLLFVGTLEPRKNVKTLIKAFKIIKKETDLKIILCGKKGWKYQEVDEMIQNPKFKDCIINFDYVTNDEKLLLMKNCFAFVFPSLYEGFGLPVVEAMKMGALSIVSNNSSLKELVEKDELRFETLEYKELASKIIDLYDNNKVYQELKEYCKERAEAFDWKETAKFYLEQFNSLK